MDGGAMEGSGGGGNRALAGTQTTTSRNTGDLNRLSWLRELQCACVCVRVRVPRLFFLAGGHGVAVGRNWKKQGNDWRQI